MNSGFRQTDGRTDRRKVQVLSCALQLKIQVDREREDIGSYNISIIIEVGDPNFCFNLYFWRLEVFFVFFKKISGGFLWIFV